MTLLTIAELLAGEALVTPGGPVDRMTAISDEPPIWSSVYAATVEIEISSADARVHRREEVPATV